MNKLNQLLKTVAQTPPISGLLLLGAALLGVWYVTFSASWDSALALWAWGAAILYPLYAEGVENKTRWQHPQKPSQWTAWALLALALLLTLTGAKLWVLPTLLAAGVFFFGNLRMGLYGAGALLVWTLILPQAEYLQHLISLPMRIMSAGFSSEILSLFGFDSMADQTAVSINGKLIAITAACSGIEQLEAMLFICWILSFSMQRGPLYQLLHFFMLLPILLVSNTIRLVITLLGVEIVGDIFISDTVHTSLGFGMVLLSILLFVGVGALFPKKAASQKTE
ncbi:MAG: archaeosortase/exosortase family protein [Limisphaerales bacterium]|jgi:exosortase/archaeosortase family protein|nr:archaeosortase/exosortase family protein [Verrucomicrobiota bacterium]